MRRYSTWPAVRATRCSSPPPRRCWPSARGDRPGILGARPFSPAATDRAEATHSHLRRAQTGTGSRCYACNCWAAIRRQQAEGQIAYAESPTTSWATSRRNGGRDIPTYAQVQYQDVYPGIGLVYYGNQQQLEYDFHVAPEADPSQIRLRFAGAENCARR